MERHFDMELKLLKERLLYMGEFVEKMIQEAVEIFISCKDILMEEIYKKEAEVNKLHIEVDGLCLRLLALRQPEAGDLRFITAAAKINSDLERLGDHAVNIGQNSIQLLKHPTAELISEIPQIADLACEMVRSSLEAFIKKDAELAYTILTKDKAVDNLKNIIFQKILTWICKEPSYISRGLDLILITRNLERVGDYATNISEDVIFMVLGKDVRHPAKLKS